MESRYVLNMPNYIPYSPWTDAANTMSGAGSGIAQVIAQQPEMALRRMQLQQQLMMMPQQQALTQQHSALYGAQTALANAQAGKATAETQRISDEGGEDKALGSAFAAVLSGDVSPQTRIQLFQGLAQKAKNNPEQLANAASHMAAVLSSGMLTNQPLAQAALLGNKTYGNPMTVAPGATVMTGTGDDFGPAYTAPGVLAPGGMQSPGYDYSQGQPQPLISQPMVNTNFPPRAASRPAWEQDMLNKNAAIRALYVHNPLTASDPGFTNSLAQIQGMPTLAAPTNNVPYSAPAQGASTTPSTNTFEDYYLSLPKGSQYKDPQGNTRIKQ